MSTVCTWCDLPLAPDLTDTEIDHIIPLYWGGPDEPWNLQPLHKHCNRVKGNKLTGPARELARQHGISLTPRKQRAAQPTDTPETAQWLAEWYEAVNQIPERMTEDPWLLLNQKVLVSTLRRAVNRGMYLAWRDGRASLGDLARITGSSRTAVRKRIRIGLADKKFDSEARLAAS